MEAERTFTIVFGGGALGVFHKLVSLCAEHASAGGTLVDVATGKYATTIAEDQVDPWSRDCDVCTDRLRIT
jgi:hypothetical protein